MSMHYDCCEHCEHDINDPPHDQACDEGCNDYDDLDCSPEHPCSLCKSVALEDGLLTPLREDT